MSSGDIRQRRPQKAEGQEKDKQSKTEPKTPQRWIVTFLLALVCSLAALIIGFILMPSPVEPMEYILPDPPEHVGPLAPNDILKHAERLYEGKIKGPESIVVDKDHIYVATEDGWVYDLHKGEAKQLVRFGKGLCGGIENENTCGRPLGMRMDKNGFLIVIDAYYGLFQVNVATGDYVTLYSTSTPVNGKPVKLLNDLDFGADGKIYFTQTSTKWQRNQFYMVMMEGQPDGRILVYDPKTQAVSEVMDGLRFPNGIQLTKDKSAILVVETLGARVWKYDIKSGKASVWADNVPGYPDNIRYSKSSGTYWLGLSALRHKGKSAVDKLAPYPWIRGQLAKIMTIDLVLYLASFEGKVDTKAMTVELDEEGTILRSLQDKTGEVIENISEVEASDGVLYFGSFNAGYLGRLYTKRVPNF